VEPGVEVLVGEIPDVLCGVPVSSVDAVFTSNFLEHLPDKSALLGALRETHRILRPGGRLVILMPNIRYAFKEYWDFLDHYLPLSHVSLSEALEITGFRADHLRSRFLPYTTKSRLAKRPWLLRLYLL